MPTYAESGSEREVPFRDALKFWIKLGFISFGGPAGQIAIMHKELVERRKWISEEGFLHALNFCMLLPGPEAQQLAAYNGWRLHGVKGGIAAGAFFVIPSVFFLLVLSFIYAKYGHVNEITAVLEGFKPVVVAIVVEAVVKIGKRSLKTSMHFITAVSAFIALQFFHLPFPIIVIAALLLGFAWSRNSGSHPDVGVESNRMSHRHLLRTAAVCAALWSVPLIAAIGIFGIQDLSVSLYLFFTQAAFVTFGGAYAVLAYVNQAAVTAGWVTASQAVDGLALAETTPGPLIMVLQFIGFAAAWQNSGDHDQASFAVICALLVTFATFLPSFLFVFSGAPYVERLQGSKRLSGAMGFVTAAIVGVILNLSIVFGAAVFAGTDGPDAFAVVLAVAAFAALFFFRADVLFVVIGGGAIGLAKYLLFA